MPFEEVLGALGFGYVMGPGVKCHEFQSRRCLGMVSSCKLSSKTKKKSALTWMNRSIINDPYSLSPGSVFHRCAAELLCEVCLSSWRMLVFISSWGYKQLTSSTETWIRFPRRLQILTRRTSRTRPVRLPKIPSTMDLRLLTTQARKRLTTILRKTTHRMATGWPASARRRRVDGTAGGSKRIVPTGFQDSTESATNTTPLP